MRSQLYLIPIAAIATMPQPAQAADTLPTLAQAQQRLFPNANFIPVSFRLSTEQYIALRDSIDAPILTDRINAWRASTGGWFIADVVYGRDDFLHYAIGIAADGTVTGIEIMECAAGYYGITNPAWRHQFAGARRGRYDPGNIAYMSGVSLSSRHIADGVQRVLATYDLFLKPMK